MSDEKYITIPLTQGQVTTVDLEDADLAAFNWYAAKPCHGNKYSAQRQIGGRKNRTTLHMHRVILSRVLGRELQRSEEVDHKDGDSLNNRRANLRVATHLQNMQNRGPQRNNTSGFKGVIANMVSKSHPWSASIFLSR